MKTHFLGLALLCPTLALALSESPADTILVKIGKKASVRFYGEKKADLKALERYDWNAIVRDLNAKLGLTTPDEPRQNYVDLFGNSYLQDSTLRRGSSVVKVAEREADQPLTKTQVRRGLEQLKTSLFFSYGFAGVNYNYPPCLNCTLNPPIEGNKLFDYNLLYSRNIALGLNRYTVLKTYPRTTFGIRWGLKVEWMSYRSNHDKEYIRGGNEQGVKDFIAGYRKPEAYIAEPVPGYFLPNLTTGENEPAWAVYQKISKKKIVSSYLTLPVVPTLQFYNAEGRRTWFAGIGGYFSYLMTTKTRTDLEGSGGKRFTYSSGPRTRYGLTATGGYRGVGLFFNYDIVPKSPRNIAFGITLNGL